MKMQSVWLPALLSVLVCVVVSGHVVNQSDNNSSESNVVLNSTDIDDTDSNNTDVTNTTVPTTEAPEENRVFRLRERFHYRNRRYRLQRIREQILHSLGWTEPPQIPESVRRRVLNNTYPLFPVEPEVREDRRCFSASCILPRQINRSLWEDNEQEGFRVYINIPSRHGLTRGTLETANLNVFLTHIEGFTCHGEEVPISRTGSRFLVQVYQFTRPLRYHRSRRLRVLNRKRLIDARMVTTTSHTWVTFDVRQAVLEWVTGSRNNFGFEIMVKDENETECNAMRMFVAADCQSPPETGCREDNTEPFIPQRLPPWDEDILSNYPYLELVSRGRRHNHGSRRRFSRSVRSRSSRNDDSREQTSQHRSSHNHNVRSTQSRATSSRRDEISALSLPFQRDSTVRFCQRMEMEVEIRDDNIIAPTHYTTLICGGTCATTYNGMLQLVASRCRPTEQRPVKGLYFDDENGLNFGDLPYTEVLACGC